MTFRALISGCWFSCTPFKVLRKGKLHFECEQCGSDLGEVLKGQKFRPRREKKPKRKSADVLTLKKRSA
jgi:hypothetical protein